MRTVLVTGGAGFIGSHVCEAFVAQGERVVVVDDLSTGRLENLHSAAGSDRLVFVRADIRRPGLQRLFARHRPDLVMHLAAQPGVRQSLKDPGLDASVNLLGLVNVLECASRAGAGKVVFASSGGTIYGMPRRVPVRERARIASQPTSPYGLSKKAAEGYLRFYRSERGLDFTALALGNVYGPRQDPLGEAGVVALFGDKLLAGESPVIFGDGEQTRDFVYVGDVVSAFLAAAGRGSGRLINVGTGRETSVNEIYGVLARLARFRGRPEYVPPVPGEVRRISLDPSQAASVLEWSASTPLERGLEETLASLRRIRR
jgi:UDP-glucose 4-epimerase